MTGSVTVPKNILNYQQIQVNCSIARNLAHFGGIVIEPLVACEIWNQLWTQCLIPRR